MIAVGIFGAKNNYQTQMLDLNWWPVPQNRENMMIEYTQTNKHVALFMTIFNAAEIDYSILRFGVSRKLKWTKYRALENYMKSKYSVV